MLKASLLTLTEEEAILIGRVACELAARQLGIPVLPSGSFECAWSGDCDSYVIETHPQQFRIRLALHELFKYEQGGGFYYSETSAIASKTIQSAYLTKRGALCALIAHEVAHWALFCHDPNYGQRVHNQRWLDLVLYLRSKLFPIFDFESVMVKRGGSLDNAKLAINHQWPLLVTYSRHLCPARSPTASPMLSLSANLIESLISARAVKGLIMFSDMSVIEQ